MTRSVRHPRAAPAENSPTEQDIDPQVVAQNVLSGMFVTSQDAAGLYRVLARISVQGGNQTSTEEINVFAPNGSVPSVFLVHREGPEGSPTQAIRAVTLFQPGDSANPSQLVMDGRAGSRDTVLLWTGGFWVVPNGRTYADAITVEASPEQLEAFTELAEQLSRTAIVVTSDH